MSEIDFIDMRTLVKKMIMGEIQINRPITLTSKDRTETECISFMSHLLKYNGVTKKNMFVFLNETLSVFNMQLQKLMKNPNINNYIQHVKSEWGITEDILHDNTNDELESNVKLLEELVENMNDLCSKFRDTNIKVDFNDDNDVVYEDELIENIDEFLSGVHKFNEHTDNLNKYIDEMVENIDKVNMEVLMDLSMKGKLLYLKFNDIKKDDNISGFIHNIFLNYILIVNLIKKHLIYYKNVIKKVSEISNNMSKYMKSNRVKLKKHDSMFLLKEQEEELEKYFDALMDVS